MAPSLTAAQGRPAPPSAEKRTRHRRWRWGIIGLFGLVAAAHAPILRGLARALIIDDPAPSAGCVLVLDVDCRFDRAAEMYHSGTASRILVIDRPATRLVRLGVVSSVREQSLRELSRRDVSSRDVILLPGSDKTPWHIAHALQAWLLEHPTEHVLVLCRRFSGRNLRFVASNVMQPGEVQRLAFRDMPDHRYSETNWWLNRAGVRALTGALCNLVYDALHGEDTATANEFDPDEYERELRFLVQEK
ncbi:MAG TPA: hypothetical protein VHC22_23720 [Pirellulales bacterium]|nr:hypothetical protein [Pirellulales bacterium]